VRGQYLAARLGSAVPTLLVVSALVFALIRLAPGGPEQVFLGEQGSAEEVARLRVQLGLDRPWPVQYWQWLGRALRGDLGRSFQTGTPVTALIGEHLGPTLQLTGVALLLALTAGVAGGIVAAVRPHSLLDRAATSLALVGISFPAFWLGIMLILLFSGLLGWLPSSGLARVGEEDRLLSRLSHAILPSVTLATYQLAIFMRFTRASLLDVIRQEYVTVARAKGLSEARTILRHALRNALLPVITILGFSVRLLVSGAVLVETVFAWPGVGRLATDAVFQRDYPVVLGVTVMVATVTVLVNVVVDLVYAAVDPRIALAGR
jgi:peptide/nickel transport system permease protein